MCTCVGPFCLFLVEDWVERMAVLMEFMMLLFTLELVACSLKKGRMKCSANQVATVVLSGILWPPCTWTRREVWWRWTEMLP